MSETGQEWRGKVGGKNEKEIEDFLQRGLCMRLSCLTPDGDPYITVTWHEWRDGYFWLVVRQRSRWAEFLKNDPRVSFLVDIPETLEKVLGQGTAEIVEEPNIGGEWVPIVNRMAVRYLGEDGPAYVEPTLTQPRWLIRIKPTETQTWQGVGWARRYWVEDTGGVSYEEAHGLE